MWSIFHACDSLRDGHMTIMWSIFHACDSLRDGHMTIMWSIFHACDSLRDGNMTIMWSIFHACDSLRDGHMTIMWSIFYACDSLRDGEEEQCHVACREKGGGFSRGWPRPNRMATGTHRPNHEGETLKPAWTHFLPLLKACMVPDVDTRFASPYIKKAIKYPYIQYMLLHNHWKQWRQTKFLMKYNLWLKYFVLKLFQVSIIPRTKGALGFAQYLPSDQKLYTTEQVCQVTFSNVLYMSNAHFYFLLWKMLI